MRIIAPMMILIMMTSTLAGCTGGDPDSGGEIDADALNDLIDQNLQDFINNTTITVENHYHNNTTITNDNTDNSVSNINGSVSTSTLKMFTVEWNKLEYILEEENIGDKIVTLTGGNNNSTNGGGDNTLLFSYGYNGFVIELRLNCREYMHYRDNWDYNEWEDWLIDNYGYNNNADNLASDIRNDISSNWYGGFGAQEQCYYPNGISLGSYRYVDDIILYEIELEQGEAISILVNGEHVTTDVNCEDGYGTGLGNGTSTTYIGGQSECTVTGSTNLQYYANSYNTQVYDNYADRYIYDYQWYFGSGGTPESFAVYFTLNQVEVHDFEE